MRGGLEETNSSHNPPGQARASTASALPTALSSPPHYPATKPDGMGASPSLSYADSVTEAKNCWLVQY